MAEKNTNSSSNYITSCLCKLQLPHTEEHAKRLPNTIMPTIQISGEKHSALDTCGDQSKRVQELLQDVDAARTEDLQLQRKLQEDAEELLRAYKEGEKCDHWTLHELGESGMNESTVRLKYELNHSRFQLAEARNKLHSLKRETAAYEKLVRQEIGDNVSLQEVLTSTRWKGRAQEIKRLKSEIADMESKAYDHKYLKNPLCIPSYKSRFPDVNDLVPPAQVRVLQNEAKKKKDLREKTEKEVAILIEQYGNTNLMYKASLTHNKMLTEELRSIKDQLDKYEARAKDDKELLKNLMAHQMQMKLMVDREAHLSKLVKKKKKDEEIDVEKENVLDAAKYKALYEASEAEKCALEKMVEMLTHRMERIIESAEEAERHCADNETRRQEMEQQIEAQKTVEQPASKSKDAKTKANKSQAKPASKSMTTPEQLAAVKEENKFLRDFLLKAIETKVDDLKLYQFTMNSIREQYVSTLKELKSHSEAPPTEEAKAK